MVKPQWKTELKQEQWEWTAGDIWHMSCRCGFGLGEREASDDSEALNLGVNGEG